jgi:hypothetical protein
MQIRTAFKSSLFAALTIFTAVTATAQPVIDQEQPVISTTLMFIGSNSLQKVAQVFTAGRSGYLSYVTVPVACMASARLHVAITETNGLGAPGGVLLAEETLRGANYPGGATSFRIIQFCSPAYVTAGQQYALTLDVPNAPKLSCGLLVGPTGDTYAGGVGYFDALPNSPGWNANIPEMDLAFQTYVDQIRQGCCGTR